MPTGGVEVSTQNISGWFNAGVAVVGDGKQTGKQRNFEAPILE